MYFFLNDLQLSLDIIVSLFFQANVSYELNNLFFIFHQGVEIFDLIEIQGRQWRREGSRCDCPMDFESREYLSTLETTPLIF